MRLMVNSDGSPILVTLVEFTTLTLLTDVFKDWKKPEESQN